MSTHDTAAPARPETSGRSVGGGRMRPLAQQLRTSAALIYAAADAMKAQAAALEDRADAIDAQGESNNELLNLKQLGARFGFSREGLASASRSGLVVHKGPRGRVMAFERDVVAWIESRDWKPVRKAPAPASSLDESDARNAAMLADLEAAQ